MLIAPMGIPSRSKGATSMVRCPARMLKAPKPQEIRSSDSVRHIVYVNSPIGRRQRDQAEPICQRLHQSELYITACNEIVVGHNAATIGCTSLSLRKMTDILCITQSCRAFGDCIEHRLNIRR